MLHNEWHKITQPLVSCAMLLSSRYSCLLIFLYILKEPCSTWQRKEMFLLPQTVSFYHSPPVSFSKCIRSGINHILCVYFYSEGYHYLPFPQLCVKQRQRALSWFSFSIDYGAKCKLFIYNVLRKKYIHQILPWFWKWTSPKLEVYIFPI